KAQTLSKEAGDLSKIANLSVQIGEVAFRMGLANEAEASFKYGAETYQALDQQANYARTLSKLGILYDLQGNISNGILLCQKALAIAKEIGDDWVIAEAYLNLSSIYFRARDWQASLTAVQTARNYFLKLQRSKEATKTLLTIIAISSEMGDWKQVEALSKSLMEDLIISEDIRTISQLKNNLGVAAYGQENFSRAEAFWQEALTLHSQIQEPLELASLYNNLGMVYTKLNEWDTAEEMLQQAIAAYKSIGDTYHWANALDNLADLYESQGKSTDYFKTIRNAINGLQFIKDTPHAHELLNKMQNRILNSPFSPKQPSN
ncbi:MAG: tetratricopeptide repeat protein, partial [Anaerolineales bacterium]|nr:tetratricopeptide repeat protein [Anaerolineales bacterium]